MSESHIAVDISGFRHAGSLQLADTIVKAKLLEHKGQTIIRIMRGSATVLEGSALRDILGVARLD